MHGISRKRLNDFAVLHPDCRSALAQWHAAMKSAAFADIQAVRAVFPHANKMGKFTVFNVGGNKVRVIAAIPYNRGKVYIGTS